LCLNGRHFEPRPDLDPWRDKLWDPIEQTPHLNKEERGVRSFEVCDEAGIAERLSWRAKKESARLLDGRTWDGYPFVTDVSAETLRANA
jgi:hypothetical protein